MTARQTSNIPILSSGRSTERLPIECLRRPETAFRAMAEVPGLYRSPSDHHTTATQLLTLRTGVTEECFAQVILGIVYSKRMLANPGVSYLLDEIVNASRLAPESSIVAHVAILVEAATRIVVGGEYDAVSLLERSGGQLEETVDWLRGLTLRWQGLAYMRLGKHSDAEAAYASALSILKHSKMPLSYLAALNEFAALYNKRGYHLQALDILRFVAREYERLGLRGHLRLSMINVGIAYERLGHWHQADKCYRRAVTDPADERSHVEVGAAYTVPAYAYTNRESLLVSQRKFVDAEISLKQQIDSVNAHSGPRRVRATTFELLGILYLETGRLDDARAHLVEAYEVAVSALPDSDIVNSALRHLSELELKAGEYESATRTAIESIQVSRGLRDRYELGAAARVLGEAYAARGDSRRANAALAFASRLLHESFHCYELMRALYAQGKFFATQNKREDAEVALLEARQLAKKLELDYYQALIAIALMDTLGPQERFDEANTWLNEATALRDNLEGIDRDRVEKELKRAAEELQVAMTRASVRSAETLKTICRVYEDARFPFEDLKPDLSYQVAQSVGADCLFVAGRHGGGYRVPLTYNIAVNEAKELVRQMDRGPRKDSLLGVDSEPRVLRTLNDRTMVAVPCSHEETSRRDPTNYVLCVRFEQIVTVTSRQLEILCASAEALARLIEVEEERHGSSKGDADDDTVRIKHPRGSFKDILTIDPDMIKVIRTAERAATSVAPILLEGETGVGKELFASAIHGASHRKNSPFVAINAGGLSVHLIESELFGHVKGSFTGANGDRIGLIETARGGTLFLDEIGEMSEELQVKLLRLLENGEYRRLGESAVRRADVRVISATNRDLKKEVERGAFRRDLFYRVSPIRLYIPPLRLRARDIQLLVRHFLRDCAALNGIANRYIEIDVKAMEALELYDWPGNVRELYNEILRLVSLIGKGDLVKFVMLSDNIKDYLKSRNRGDGLLDRSVEQYERRLLLNALDKNDWNRMRTADSVGVPRTTLLAKLKRLNVASK